MATRTIVVHDRCTVPQCNRVLHSIKEGESGLCSTCWFKKMPQDTKDAMKKLLASAFNDSTDAEKDQAVKTAMEKIRRDQGEAK